MVTGEPYDPTAPELVEERETARRLIRLYNETVAGDTERRSMILEELFGSGGGDAVIEPPFRCDYGWNVHVGADFYANFGCVFLDVREIRFGESCLLGPGVHVYTPTHPLDPAERTAGLESGEPVEIGDDAVVAAGAVVVDDVPDGVVVGGNPAEVLRDLDEPET